MIDTYNGLPVTEIGALRNLSFITKVTIGDSVTSIGSRAFEGCSNLTGVYYTGSEAKWHNITIGVSNDCLINVTKHYNYVPQ